jgi:hypothetical protein
VSRAGGRSPYLVGPAYDWTLILGPPALALIVGMLISGSLLASDELEVAGEHHTYAGLFIGTLIHAHLVAVVFRSHGNRNIFRLYPQRFVAVPIVLWLAIMASPWIAITATVVATFWDVWHSGAQTFGFGRIYDRNCGAPPEVGRKLDYWLNHLLYAGPILAGVSLMDHVDVFHDYGDIGATFFTHVPAYVEGHQRYLTWAVLVGGTIFVGYYLLAYWRLHRQGYAVSPLKVWLIASTGLCSVYTWGFNSWGMAFFIMNLFHAVQYLAVVWAMEKKRIMERLRVSSWRWGKLSAGGFFLGSVFAYGLTVHAFEPDLESFWALTMVVSLMHFWYDGFIWSVTKQQV